MQTQTIKILLLIFLVNLSLYLESQIVTPAYIDSCTYVDYLKSDWHSLTKNARKARKHNIDFQYLTIRTGIAYYEQGKYMLALPYFEKAYNSDNSNSVLNEYLYYSYLFSGRYKNAQQFSEKISENDQERLKISKPAALSSVSFFTKYASNSDYSVIPTTITTLYQTITKSYRLDGIECTSDKFLKYSIGFGGMQASVNKEITALGNFILPPFYSEKTNQTDYYAFLSRYFKYGVVLTGTVHGLKGNISADNPYSPADSDTLYTAAYSALWTGLSVYKYNRFVGLGATISISNLNSYKTFEKNFKLNIFPFSDTNACYTAQICQNSITDTAGTLKKYNSHSHAVSIKLFDRFIVEPSYTIGSKFLFSESEGTLLDNETDVTGNRIAVLCYYTNVKQNLNVYLKYEHSEKQNLYVENNISKNIGYINQSITGGFIWNFQK